MRTYFQNLEIYMYNIERLKIETYVIVHVIITPNRQNSASTMVTIAPSNP